MKKQTILIDFPEEFRADHEKLQRCIPDAEFMYAGTEPDTTMLAAADIIVGLPRPDLLKNTRQLKWLQILSAGADRYVVPGILPEDTILTNATGAYGKSMGEFMICAVLSLMLDFPHYRDNQKKHVWKNSGNVRHIAGTTALVIGFGNIGREFAVRYKALGGRIIGVKRTPAKEKPDYADELHTIDELDSLIPRADVITLSVPSTKETAQLFGAEQLSRMKSGALLVNVGRGTAVDTTALSDALYAGKIGGAALDVTAPEPLPAGHPLWDAPRTIITPHVSGGWEVPENTGRVLEIVYENLRRYAQGQPLLNVVDRKTGYCVSGN
ncbi:MAG: D-2-hydroxyacid dehydrogenase [Treponema sp.]|jgi:phosphoglycerate dehydrogenase-like enzyme|nr:D-2-hydroxyacid dehydrogenase [Treponema sp.]